MTEAKMQIETVAAELGLTMTAEFIPWSRSRLKDDKQPSLNWRITLCKGGKIAQRGNVVEATPPAAFLTTDYSAGCGHCPAYKQNETADSRLMVKWECEHGRRAHSVNYAGGQSYVRPLYSSTPILPQLADVLASLVLDAEALGYVSFDNWATALGMDADSRKAEAMYKACLETGLKLRNGLGEDGLRRLREACQDY